MLENFVMVNGTTTSNDEDIMTFLKTKTTLNGSTEDISFNLTSLYFETASNTGIKVNNEADYSDLRQDLTDGLYKCEIPANLVSVKTLVIEDTGVDYFCRFTY